MLSRREFVAMSAAAGVAGGAEVSGKALIAFRIGTALWLDDKKFRELMEFFAGQPGAVDELMFFTSNTHPPLPLKVMEQRASRLAELMPQVRKAGMKAGINILATMGHHSENLANSLSAPWQLVMDPSGKTAPGVYCPASEELHEYARRIYTAMAKAGPDVIWVDDDIRLYGHTPVRATCFCDGCMRRFSAKVGGSITQDALVANFDSGPDRMKWRKAWLNHNRDTINDLFTVIEKAAHAVKPDLVLGFMTGDRFYEGYDFARWAKTLAGPRNVEVRWRPGGGFYSDEAPLGMVEKAHAMGRQVAALPPEVKVIQSELENFPYQRLRKAVHTTVTEAACHMAAGTTGTAFNVLTMTEGTLDEYKPLYAGISGWREFYTRMKQHLGREMAVGLWPAWSHDSYAAVNFDGNWLSPGKMALDEMYTLGEIGIPLCYDQRGAAVTALAGAGVRAFSTDQLKRILSGGCLMDVAAWKALSEMGLGEFTPVRAVEGYDRDATEVFNDDALNGRFSGWGRDCRQSFWKEWAYKMELVSGARALSRMVDYGGKDMGIASAVGTNSLGGRVAVMGYYPWTQLHSIAKASQMKSLTQWLSGDKMPVVVEDYAKVIVWMRGKSFVVLNASLDPVRDLEVKVRGGASKFALVRPGAKSGAVTAETAGGGYVRVKVPEMGAWGMVMLTAEG